MKITVMLSTYNGEKYLKEQMNSLLTQDDCCEKLNINIVVRDDGSHDKTKSILNEYAQKYPQKITVYKGRNIGWANSFIELLFLTEKSDFYAFCDQDDIWEKDKIATAVRALEMLNNPALYCCSALLVDNTMKAIGIFDIPTKFDIENTIIKCRVLGCTQVFNYALYKELIKIRRNQDIAHDWWTICVALLCGEVITDSTAHILYRQSGSNVLGGNRKITDRLKKILRDDSNKREKLANELINTFPDMNNNFLRYVAGYRKSKYKLIKLLFYHFTNVSLYKQVFFKIYLLLRKV